MHPILFRIPLPRWTLPLGVTFAVLSVLGALVAVFGWRRRARDLLLVGAALFAFGALAALVTRGERFELGPIPVKSYGAMLCVSLVIGWHLTLRQAARGGFSRELAASYYVVAVLCGFVGARVFYVLCNLGEFASAWDVLAVRGGGLVAYGGFVTGLLGSWWFARRRAIELSAWVDLAAPGLAAGILFTRFGCYLFGCDFGEPLPSSAPAWLARLGTFPRWEEGTAVLGAGSPAWLEHVSVRGLSHAAAASLPVHPTQLYEALAGGVLLAVVLAVRARSRFRGQTFLALGGGYALLRFLIETLRGDRERGSFGPDLAEHWLAALGLAAMGVAAAAGPLRSVAAPRLRWALRVAAFAPALLAWLVLRPPASARAIHVEASTSQWLALATFVAAAAAWVSSERRARAQAAQV